MGESAYSFQMQRSDHVHLNIDHIQMGVGGIDSWKKGPLKDYLLVEPRYEYTYRIQPVQKQR